MTDAIAARTSLSIRETTTRMTPEPPSRRFAEILARSGSAVVQGALAAAPFVPGGNLVAAAIRGAPLPMTGGPVGLRSSQVEAPAPTTSGSGSLSGGLSGGALAGGSPVAGGDDDILARGQDMSLRMLRLQEAIGEENRRYTALSNVLHARHEMAKNAIGNIR